LGLFDKKDKGLILDKKRIQYLHDHLREVLQAYQAKENVIGYSL
jgi:beta-glucosidase/6-phospho-beta-glucosidase/beta-galactosidase